MRKIIVSAIVFIVILLVFGPFVTGLWFQKSYKNFISSYQNNENIHLAIIDYHRGWFHSDATLQVEVNQKFFNEGALLTFFIKQHIQHGPIISHHWFRLAAIQNNIWLKQSDIKIESDSFATFFGNYFTHLNMTGFNMFADIKNMSTDFWIFPRQQRIKGEAELTGVFFQSQDDVLMLPDVKIQWDQYLDKHELWLGSGSMAVSEIVAEEKGEELFRVTDLNAEGFTEANDDFLNIDRKIKIKNIHFMDQALGPVDFQMRIQNLYLPAIHDLWVSYKDIVENGEVYQGQLRQKISMILPKIIRAESAIQLDKLDIMAFDGNVTAHGKIEWPSQPFVSLSGLRELVEASKMQAEIKISKKLLSQFIHLASNMPDFIRDVAEPQKNMLMDARDQMEFAMMRNSLFIDYLSDRGYISKKAQDILIEMQRNFTPLDDYTKVVRDLFLDRQIALIVSYQLCWQYAQILKPYEFLDARVDEYKKIAEKQLDDIFLGYIKKGYVRENNGEYVANLKWLDSVLTSNGIEVKGK